MSSSHRSARAWLLPCCPAIPPGPAAQFDHGAQEPTHRRGVALQRRGGQWDAQRHAGLERLHGPKGVNRGEG